MRREGEGEEGGSRGRTGRGVGKEEEEGRKGGREG